MNDACPACHACSIGSFVLEVTYSVHAKGVGAFDFALRETGKARRLAVDRETDFAFDAHERPIPDRLDGFHDVSMGRPIAVRDEEGSALGRGGKDGGAEAPAEHGGGETGDDVLPSSHALGSPCIRLSSGIRHATGNVPGDRGIGVNVSMGL